MRSEPGQGLRNNSNLLSRDTMLQTTMSHQDAGRIQYRIDTKIQLFNAYMSSCYVKNTCAWTPLQSTMTAYLSEGQFPQEVGTAGPAPLSSDDLTEKKTDWINIVVMWPFEVDACFQFITTH